MRSQVNDQTECFRAVGDSSPEVAAKAIDHICVCVCTYKRPEFLRRLLQELARQETGGLFTYSVVVADNDCQRSAESVVSEFAAASNLPIRYCAEPQQSIALARNRAITNALGDFIAFIDDDEFPAPDWLHNMFKAYATYGVDGVLGPVRPYFEHQPPRWIKDGGFFDRPEYATGYRLSWPETRTGNVLFKKSILDGVDIAFRPEFGTGGEDVDFFRRMTGKGHSFIWCNEAVAHEVVPMSRCRRSYLLRRALLRGSNAAKNRTHRVKNAAKSLIAVPCYTLALPFLALFGQHWFVKYLVKLCDHGGRLLAFIGLPLVTQRET